uniref:Uncharacterized protein n=1 Tax=Rhizophora mucronata TaxID=61149 RepID=A0A2P2MTS7_RHIMU
MPRLHGESCFLSAPRILTCPCPGLLSLLVKVVSAIYGLMILPPATFYVK